MARKTKARWLRLLSLALLVPSLLGAQGAGQCGCAEISMTGEALYWAPSQCDFFFAARGETELAVPDDVRLAIAADYQNQVIEPGYDWGLRIGLEYARGCWSARARYLWLETNARKSVLRGDVNTLLIPLLSSVAELFPSFDSAIGSTEEIYQNFDLTIGLEAYRTCRAAFTILASGQGLCIRDRRRVTADGVGLLFIPEPTDAPVHGDYLLDASFWGFGMGFGGHGRANLGCGFSLVGEAQFLALVGYKRAKSDTSSLTIGLFGADYTDTRKPSVHVSRPCTTPGVQGSLGLEYCHDVCCGTLCAHIGYETHFYYGVVDATQEDIIVQGRPSNTQALTENAGFGGLNLGLTYSY